MRMRFASWLLALIALSTLGGAGVAVAQTQHPALKNGKIHRLDPALDALIPPGAVIEQLAEGFEWTEGPVWIKDGNYLLFSDIPNNAILKWQEGKGVSLFLRPAGYTGEGAYGLEPGTNGLARDAAGDLICCEHGDRRISRLDKTGVFKTTLAKAYQGKRFNSPNDLVYKSNGDLYFTDPPYGLPGNFDDPRRELDFCGVYRLSKDGTVTLLTDQMSRPNGIAFSPDEKTLYVAQSDPKKAIVMAFPVKEDGLLGEGRLFWDATDLVGKLPGLPDGMKVDQKGNVYATGPGGVHIFSPDGKKLGQIETGEKTANCAWGDDGSTLYITADMYIVRVKTNAKGFGF